VPKSQKQKQKQQKNSEPANIGIENKDSGYLCSMSLAPKIHEKISPMQILPIIFFTAVIIIVVRMIPYSMPLDQFYWFISNERTDFFSYGKMILILICGALVLLMLLYRVFAQSFAVKKTFVYIPMFVFTLFVVLSYVFSDYREFALLGMVDRFEGTLVLLSYMILLFYVINTINTEKSVKFVLYPIAVSGALLSLLGISQAIGRDFFQTGLGKMMIVPPSSWDRLDNIVFKFQDGEIYQSVYNINYVSFYLTLLLPVFGLLFIHSIMKGKDENIVKKIIWGILFALLLFNLIGSQSSGGLFGMFVVVIAAIILLYKKILTWWKPLAILLVTTALIAAGTVGSWLPEIKIAVGAFDSEQEEVGGKAYIDYLELIPEAFMIDLSVNGNGLVIALMPDMDFAPDIHDNNGQTIDLLIPEDEDGEFVLHDERFNMCSVRGIMDSRGNSYFLLKTDAQEWMFRVGEGGMYFVNGLGKFVELEKIESIGFEDNPHFGSGRGYIWSRTLPMMRDTIFLGRGADTYLLYFPHNDYLGKYNAGWEVDGIVDKPHNMYMHMAVGTGGISLLSFLTLLGFYFVQSFRIYRKRDYKEFIEIAGLGIFLGILGFAAAGLVNDSSVSVMPLFYGLLGTGIAVNIMIKRRSVSVG